MIAAPVLLRAALRGVLLIWYGGLTLRWLIGCGYSAAEMQLERDRVAELERLLTTCEHVARTSSARAASCERTRNGQAGGAAANSGTCLNQRTRHSALFNCPDSESRSSRRCRLRR